MDRGYIHFARLMRFTREAAFFVIRSMDKLKYDVIATSPHCEAPVVSDSHIIMAGRYTSADYPVALRRIEFLDIERARTLTFLTNKFQLPASRIAQLYKSRWQVELFFKWIKQNLRIKAFVGNSVNAVKTQIWIAITTYVLVAVIRKRLHIQLSLHSILQVLSLALFERAPLSQLLADALAEDDEQAPSSQFSLFENISGQ
jgi:IS4 transposase